MRGIHRWRRIPLTNKGQWRRALIFLCSLRLNKRLTKQSSCRWCDTPLRLLWRHCNVMEVHGNKSNPFFENNVFWQKHPREVITCRNNIPYIMHVENGNFHNEIKEKLSIRTAHIEKNCDGCQQCSRQATYIKLRIYNSRQTRNTAPVQAYLTLSNLIYKEPNLYGSICDKACPINVTGIPVAMIQFVWCYWPTNTQNIRTWFE